MERIEERIHLVKKAKLEKARFINQELKPSISTSFDCCECGNSNLIEIVPYQTGFPFAQIYDNEYLTEKEIIESNIAQPASTCFTHFGKFLADDLPTLYFQKKCSDCDTKHIVVFGFGEQQPSLMVCKISGIWLIKKTSEIL